MCYEQLRRQIERGGTEDALIKQRIGELIGLCKRLNPQEGNKFSQLKATLGLGGGSHPNKENTMATSPQQLLNECELAIQALCEGFEVRDLAR